jgi:hypothetical protein
MTPTTFEKLIEILDSLDYNTAIYGNLKAWEKQPLQEQLYIATLDERSEPDFDSKLAKNGMRKVFPLQMLQDIVEVERKKRPSATIEDFVAAAKHYREFDDFRP